jgi:long-subunit acyl-CoA synthetase (AMP-forming)
MDVAQFLIRAVQLYPQNTAVIQDTNTELNYKEFELLVRKMACGLRKTLSNGDHFAILSYNSSNFLNLMYSLSYSRLVMVPVNWRCSAEELAFILQNADCKGVLSSRVRLLRQEWNSNILGIYSNILGIYSNILGIYSNILGIYVGEGFEELFKNIQLLMTHKFQTIIYENSGYPLNNSNCTNCNCNSRNNQNSNTAYFDKIVSSISDDEAKLFTLDKTNDEDTNLIMYTSGMKLCNLSYLTPL